MPSLGLLCYVGASVAGLVLVIRLPFLTIRRCYCSLGIRPPHVLYAAHSLFSYAERLLARCRSYEWDTPHPPRWARCRSYPADGWAALRYMPQGHDMGLIYFLLQTSIKEGWPVLLCAEVSRSGCIPLALHYIFLRMGSVFLLGMGCATALSLEDGHLSRADRYKAVPPSPYNKKQICSRFVPSLFPNLFQSYLIEFQYT